MNLEATLTEINGNKAKIRVIEALNRPLYDSLKRDDVEKWFGYKFAAVFERYPDLEEVSWRTYTPSFNDGDICYLRSDHDEPTIEGYEWRAPEYNKISEEVGEFPGMFDEDDLVEFFGDGHRGRATRDGFDVDTYYD